MNNENEENKNKSTNPLKLIAGIIIGSLMGAMAMLLLAPKSGKDTRVDIQKKGTELRDQAAGYVDNIVIQVRSTTTDIANSGRLKIEEIKQRGQDLAIERSSS